MPPIRSSKKNEGEKRVLANRYQVEKKLGSGNFGVAFLVKDLRKSAELKVLKEIAVGDLAPDETVDAMHEAKLLSKLDNPGIVKFHDSFLDGEYFGIITEYCEGGDLDQKIESYKKSGKRFKETQIVEWTIELLLAVQHMHSRRVLHRDLKTRNIFLKNNRIKIGDFGISRILMGTIDMASTFTGTPYYMSPEVLKHEGYNSKSDIWSVGCIVYELGALEHAFEGQSLMGVMYKIVEGDCPQLPEQYSKELSVFLKKLLIKDPEQRPSAGDALKTPFIAKQLERLRDGLVDKRNQKLDNTIIATREANELAQDLKKKSRLRDLQAEEENVKFKNLTPRERMRRRKMEEADKKGEKLRQEAHANLLANRDRQQTVLDMKYKPSTLSPKSAQYASSQAARYRPTKSAHIPAKSLPVRPPSREYHISDDDYDNDDYDEVDDDDDDEGTILQPLPRSSAASRSRYRLAEHDQSPRTDDDDDIVTGAGDRSRGGTLKARDDGMMGSGDSGVVSLNDVALKAATSYDDRPIAPMRNTMVYNAKYSSLDFEDGIPDKPDLAESFYSQYDDFEEVEEGEDAGRGGEAEATDEEQDLIDNMEHVLAQTDGGMRTQTLNDNNATDAFGPVARLEKIRNMRRKCVQELGEEVFKKVYDHIRDFRSKNRQQAADDTVMMRGLLHLVARPSDAFVVDQLVFMELES